MVALQHARSVSLLSRRGGKQPGLSEELAAARAEAPDEAYMPGGGRGAEYVLGDGV